MPTPNRDFIVLYDGECGLCDHWVQFVLRHDRSKAICFAPLQSQFSGDLLSGIQHPPLLSTVVAWVRGRPLLRSDAVCAIFQEMGGPWPVIASAVGLVPRPIRDAGYNFVAAHRQKWFPFRGASCRLVSEEEQRRFLA